MTRNIKAIIQYDGTDYCGFQAQVRQGSPTIQETVEAALSRFLGEPTVIYGSGRTDSGVHALAQVINFYTTSTVPLEKIVPAVNHLLPQDIVFLQVEEVDKTFHARKCALGKYYEYRVLNNNVPTAIGSRYFYRYPYALDEGLVRQGCRLLEGTHDFKSFSASGSSVQNFVRTLYTVDLVRQDDWWIFRFYGTGFLRNMVRIMVGTLLDIGNGRRPLANISQALAEDDRTLAGKTAPAQGLFLKMVFYP